MISPTILYIVFIFCIVLLIYCLYKYCACENYENETPETVIDPHIRVPKIDKEIRKLCKSSGFNAIFIKKKAKNEPSEWSFEDNDTSVNQGHLRYREIDPNGRVVKELVQDLYVKSFVLDKQTKTYKGKMRRFFQDPSNSDPEEVHFEYNPGNGKLKLKFSPTFVLRGEKVPEVLEMQKM